MLWKRVWILVVLYSKPHLLYTQRRSPDLSVCRAVAEYGALNVATIDGPAKVCSSPSGIVRIPFLEQLPLVVSLIPYGVPAM